MYIQDPIADMLTCIRNAQSVGMKSTLTPHSSVKSNILNVLKSEGYIEDFQVVEADNKQSIQITLKYYQGRPVIEKIKRMSKPALRVYRAAEDIPLVRGGLGVAIVSTPKGVMSGKQARAEKVGGEVLCVVEEDSDNINYLKSWQKTHHYSKWCRSAYSRPKNFRKGPTWTAGIRFTSFRASENGK